jgi:cytochrome c553
VKISRAGMVCVAAALVICGGVGGSVGAVAGDDGEASRIFHFGALGQGVSACASCHGMHGEGVAVQNGPRLAHLDQDYLDAQLEGFAAGSRQSIVMAPIAQKLTSDQRAGLSTYLAVLPAAHEAGGSVGRADLAKGQQIATIGDWSVQNPPCGSCHGPKGGGVGSLTPPLVGQTQDYLFRQLTAFRDGDRTGPLGLMSGIAKRLSIADLHAVAAYYASRPFPAVQDAASGARP